ncbi:MAG: hypothetical protein AAB513_00215 [Patescibacteria group bacterium]
MTIFLAIAFFSILFFFGWQTARFIFNENRIEYLIAFAGIFGIGLYTFFINVAGLFIPIQTAFYLILLIFLLLALTCYASRRLQIFGHQKHLEWGIDTRWRKILLFFTLFLTLSVGLISFRHPMDLATIREPTAATIAEGNFPPMEIFSPTNPFRYHYAPDLFSAAIHKVTDMPLYLAYDFQNAILSGTLFLLVFLFIKLFFANNFVAFFSSLSTVYAGTLVFFEGFKGIPVLYNKYILEQEIQAPFKFISDAIVGEYTTPVINSVITLHWGAMAFSLMMIVVYIYFRLLQTEKEDRRTLIFFTGGFLFALLALVSESYFAVLSVIFFSFPFIFYFFERDTVKAKKVFVTSFFLLLIALPVAFSQGGLLSAALAQQLHLPSTQNSDETILYANNKDNVGPFKFGTPWLLYDGKPLYNPQFLVEWILLLAVLGPALVFLFRSRFDLALFLTSLILLFFSIPLFIDSDFPILAGQLGRFFYPINLFGGLLVGLFLATLYLRMQKPLLKGVLLFFVFILMAQGLFTHSVWLAFGYPLGGAWNPNAKFFAEAGTLEANAYSWVKKNTTTHDIFLIIKDDYTECGASSAPNCLFILNTGRMAPIFTHRGTGDNTESETSSPEKAILFSEASKSCTPNILRKLNYGYIYVDGEWRLGMEEKCVKNNNLELVFEGTEETKFIRIYKIKEGGYSRNKTF